MPARASFSPKEKAPAPTYAPMNARTLCGSWIKSLFLMFAMLLLLLLLHGRASLYSLGVGLEAAPLMPIQLVAFPAPPSGVLIFPNPRSRSRMIFNALRLRR